MEPANGDVIHRNVRDFQRGFDCGWRGRDEHHAGKRDRENAGNRCAQGDWGATAGYYAAIHAGGDHPDCHRRDYWHLSGSCDRWDYSCHLAVAAGKDVRVLDGIWLYFFGRSWTDLWNLSGMEGG